jgi:hypothetical protein
MFECDCGKSIASDALEDHILECVLMKGKHEILFKTLEKAYNEARGNFKAETNLKAMIVCFYDKLDRIKQPPRGSKKELPMDCFEDSKMDIAQQPPDPKLMGMNSTDPPQPEMRGTLGRGSFAIEDGDDDVMRCSSCKRFIGEDDFNSNNVYYPDSCEHMSHSNCMQSLVMK